MGVPGFHRWASQQVPKMCRPCTDEVRKVDHMYLDFNAVVHRCITAWAGVAGEERLFALVEAYVQLLLQLVCPTALLYIALDGVAPRAKMNQQRSRRFRDEGQLGLFDRNSVTPGTEFMARLGARLFQWAEHAARGCSYVIVVSTSDDPGEGEHKIMDIIRRHPHKSHCLFSNDADLIFLGLVSGAEHVLLLRETPLRPGRESGVPSVIAELVPDESPNDDDADDFGEDLGMAAMLASQVAKDFDLSELSLLSEWLLSQFPGCDTWRVLQDFVAFCCLAGNDFLPQIFALNIFEGGIAQLLTTYKEFDPAVAGYLVNDEHRISLPQWRLFLEKFAAIEAEALLSAVDLGLGDKQPQLDAVCPPPDSWDGLSVLVSGAPLRTNGGDVKTALGRQGVQVQSVHAIKGERGKLPESWLVRLADPRSAIMTLVSAREINGKSLLISWADPAKCDLVERPKKGFTSSEWKPVLEREIRNSFEYWFSAKNLPKDEFLRRHVRMREDRYVPLHVFLSFPRLRKWTQDVDLIAHAVGSSRELELSDISSADAARGESQGTTLIAVRARGDDYSIRSDENSDVLERQRKAVISVTTGDYVQTAMCLKEDYYARQGPCVAGATDTEELRCRAYLSGIQWVVTYYTVGCKSWSWFYPSHFAPLCVSLLNLVSGPDAEACMSQDSMPLGKPFPPVLQLLAVLPPKSAALLPEPLQHLLGKQTSPLADLYPSKFEVVRKEGDRPWQGAALLPFVDESRLRGALAELDWECSDVDPQPPRAFTLESGKVTSSPFSVVDWRVANL